MGLVGVVAVASGCASGGPSQETETAEIYRIHEVLIPTSFEEVRTMSFDLDGDGRRDNAAGTTLMSLFSNFTDAAETLPANINATLSDGGVTWYLALDRDEETGAPTVSLFGDAMVGDAAPGTVFADMTGDWPVTWIPAVGTVGELTVAADGMLSGTIGFAMPAESAVTLAAPMAQYFTERLQDGVLKMTANMDVNHDGVISTDEFMSWELVSALLEPDVDLAGDDGVADSWSVGVGVRAFPVTDVDDTAAAVD
ncbi:MAG TPA: hypothetical protein VMZ28_26495 [Kofleriaceae bacterium]|nr:hypothetical protein [Kofleriaceae bacterium]